MLKRRWRKIILEQKGQTLSLVLIVMLLSGLLIVPTLKYASSSLRINQQVYETKTQALYAADAGIENAIWKLQDGNPPSCNLTDVNGMDIVAVEQVGNFTDTENGRLYTLKSTAKLSEEVKAKIIAEVEIISGPTIAEGGWGGTTDPGQSVDVIALSLTSPYTLIFGTAQAESKFYGREQEPEDVITFGSTDLLELNMSTGIANEYFEFDIQGAIYGAHYYYQEDDFEYLLMTIKTDNTPVEGEKFDKNDIFRFYNHPDKGWKLDESFSKLTVEGVNANVCALTRYDDTSDTAPILFCIASNAAVGGEMFEATEIITYNFTADNYTSLVDINAILQNIEPTNPNNPGIDSLATLEPFIPGDSRILLSLKANVTGCDCDGDGDKDEILDDDIAIWDPCGTPGDFSDDTITLHIKMTGEGGPPTEGSSAVTIKSWQIS